MGRPKILRISLREKMGCLNQGLIFRIIHIVLQIVCFICCLVWVCGKHVNTCRFGTNSAYAFSTTIITLFCNILLLILVCMKCCDTSKFEFPIWLIAYHMVFAAVVCVTHSGNAAHAATCAFFWLDMIVYWVEAALMSGVHQKIKVSEDGNIQIDGKGGSGAGTSGGGK